PVRGAPDVHDEAAGGARAPSADLPGAGSLVSIATRLRDPAPAASCFLRHRARSSLAPVLPQRLADDAPHQAPLRRLRLPARGARAAFRRRIPGVEAHRPDARAVVVGSRRLGRALLPAVLPPRDPLVAVDA